MLEFLHAFVAWLVAANLLPREVSISDTGDQRENKTYLMNFPEDASNVFCVKQYNMILAPLVGKDACVRYIQIIGRNTNHQQVVADMEALFQFLINRPDFIEDMNSNYWIIIGIESGPQKLNEDSQGRYQYSLSIPITTKS